MRIQELAKQAGLSVHTLRYYESIGVLPRAKRQANGYREYSDADVERAKFLAGARRLGFSLNDNIEIIALRDKRQAPCRFILNLIEHQADEIERRIAELVRLKVELRQLRALGLKFPLNDVDGKNCVCHLVSEKANSAVHQPKRSRRKSGKR
ncbi:MAG: MerR family transcriptional regulator [Chloroflexi bacterium]|nr:MerR family transcriptional regulator [Chloroflexota bacterium]